MNKVLVLAEKPSVARDIARVLNCNKGANGYLEGERYIVTWALGHLVTLADPEAYDDRYKAWKLEDLPMLPEKMKLVVIKQTAKQYNTVREQMNRNDVKEIVIATDAGREGELVARWIIEKASIRKPLKRLWISSVTDMAIREGFNKLKDGREYENLYASAVARSEADWIVGINATRALTTKYNAQLSCGRVQTPTLAMIAKREEEIRTFVPKDFYGIAANTAKGIKLIWQDSQSKETRTFDKAKCEKILGALQKKNAQVIDIDKAYKKNFSPGLYDLTELQRDGNKFFNYSAKETLSIMQRLYESHKLLTYPRTDARYISTDIVDTLKDRVKACGVGPYAAIAARVIKNPISANKSFVDNTKVSDHHAIIPTEQKVSLGNLSDTERKIYDLVVKRFLAVLYPPFEYEQTTIKAKIGDEIFTARGKVVINQGWKEVYGSRYDESSSNDEADSSKEDGQDQMLPKVDKGEILTVSSISQTKGQTKPPALFNEGTLLSAMENPTKYMANESKDLIKIIGETGGIGTVATRADIIEKLFNSFVIEKKGKDLFITGKGKQLLELVPVGLKSPTLTAQWEQKLSAISKGSLNKMTFTNEMRAYAKEVVSEIKASAEKYKHDNMTRTKCPDCGKFLLEVNGKHGKMIVCQDRECGYRKGLARVTKARCPNCHKNLELQGQGEGQIFVCKCGYREKLSSFEKKRSEQMDKGDKRSVESFLKQQQKEEPVNSAMADALAKWKSQNK